MLQIAVERLFSSAVTDVPEIWAMVVDSLDGLVRVRRRDPDGKKGVTPFQELAIYLNRKF
jgi:hypothetical protein